MMKLFCVIDFDWKVNMKQWFGVKRKNNNDKNEQQGRNYVWAGKKLLVVTLHIMPNCTLNEVSL